jgi:hypothetical protein
MCPFASFWDFCESMAAAPSPFSSPAVAGIAQTAASLPPTVELLAYYRKRIEEFEAERAEFLKRFRTVEVGWKFKLLRLKCGICTTTFLAATPGNE